MSVAATTAVWKHSLMKRGAFTVLLALADWADDQGYVVFRRKSERTLKAIAEKARITVKALTGILPVLEEAGELVIERGGRGAGDINNYRITLPGLEEEGEALQKNKSEETSPLSGGAGENRNKSEVSANKSEVSSNKSEVCDRHIRNNQLPDNIPPTPHGGEGPPSAPPDGRTEASGKAAKGLSEGERDGGSEKRPPTPLERKRFHERRFILDWLYGQTPFPVSFRELDLRVTSDAREIELMALALSPVALRSVQGFVRWAEDVISGDPDVKPPIAIVQSLVKAMADPAIRATMQRRLNILMRMTFDEAGDDAGDEDGDGRDTERSEASATDREGDQSSGCAPLRAARPEAPTVEPANSAEGLDEHSTGPPEAETEVA